MSDSTTPEQLLSRLEELDIDYQHYEHEAVFTVEQAQKYCSHIPGGHCKNLFLRNKKKHYWLVVLKNDTVVNLKELGKTLGAGALSFASEERLQEMLDVIPGAVTPLALINDRQQQVRVAIDQQLMAFERVTFHPLVNTATVAITPKDLLRFIQSCGRQASDIILF